MRDPASSALHARRWLATRRFVIRMAKRLAATGSGHAGPRDPRYHPRDPRAWESREQGNFQHWIGAYGVTIQGQAPRCDDLNGCYGQKATWPNAVEYMAVAHLCAEAQEVADESGCDLKPVVHHARSRLWRRTHRAPLGRRSRKRKHQK